MPPTLELTDAHGQCKSLGREAVYATTQERTQQPYCLTDAASGATLLLPSPLHNDAFFLPILTFS